MSWPPYNYNQYPQYPPYCQNQQVVYNQASPRPYHYGRQLPAPWNHAPPSTNWSVSFRQSESAARGASTSALQPAAQEQQQPVAEEVEQPVFQQPERQPNSNPASDSGESHADTSAYSERARSKAQQNAEAFQLYLERLDAAAAKRFKEQRDSGKDAVFDPSFLFARGFEKPPLERSPSIQPRQRSNQGSNDTPLTLENINQLQNAMASPVVDFSDYHLVRAKISSLTVDRLKTIERYLNAKLGHNHKMGGLKTAHITQVQRALDDAKDRNELASYAEVRQAILNSDALRSSMSHSSHASPIPNTSPAIAPQAIPSAANGNAIAGPSNHNAILPARAGSQAALGPYGISQLPARPMPNLPTAGPSTAPARVSPVLAKRPAPGAPVYPPPANNGASSSRAQPIPNRNVPSPANSVPINFRSNPFYTVHRAVSSVFAAPRCNPGDRKSVSSPLLIRPDEREKLLLARSQPTAPQFQLRLFSTSEQYYNQPISSYPNYNRSVPHNYQPLGLAPVEFPATAEARVNGYPVIANLKGVKKKEGSTMPPDLNKAKVQFTGAYALNLGIGAVNQIDLTYSNSAEKKYNLVVYLVEYHTVPYLLERIKTGAVRDKAEVIAWLINQNADPDIVATSSALNLRCPLSFVRMTTPTRSKACSHMQCFEGESFLSMVEQTPVWSCPVCNKVIKGEDLILDGFTQDILNQVPDKYDTVIVEVDGTWRTDDFKIGNATSVGSVVANSRPSSLLPPVKTEREGSFASANGKGPGAVEIMDSDDDDGDVPLNKQTSTRPPPPPAKKAGVIDLTLDSDEDTPLRNAAPTPVSGNKRNRSFFDDDDEDYNYRPAQQRRANNWD